MIRSEFLTPTTRAVELQRQHDRRIAVLRAQPGFRGCLLLNSLGYPVMHVSPMYFHTTTYVLLTNWESQTAAIASENNPEWLAFVAAHPSEKLFVPTSPSREYAVVQSLTLQGEARFSWLIDVVVHGAVLQEAALTTLATLYRDLLGGFVESRVLRRAGQPDGHLLALLLKGETSFPPGEDVPEIAALLQSQFPGGVGFTPEGFEVVHRA